MCCSWVRHGERDRKVAILNSGPLPLQYLLFLVCPWLCAHTVWKVRKGSWVIITLSPPWHCPGKEGGGNFQQQERSSLLLSEASWSLTVAAAQAGVQHFPFQNWWWVIWHKWLVVLHLVWHSLSKYFRVQNMTWLWIDKELGITAWDTLKKKDKSLCIE